MAAALSYYFVLSLFPALIFLSALVAYLPVNSFDQALAFMAAMLPPDSMVLIRKVLGDVVTPHHELAIFIRIIGNSVDRCKCWQN
jgi:membrane protein